MKNKRAQKLNNSFLSNLAIKKSGLEANWSRKAVAVLVAMVIVFTATAAVVVSMLFFNSAKNRVETINSSVVSTYFATGERTEQDFVDIASSLANSFSDTGVDQLVFITLSGDPFATTTGSIPKSTEDMKDFQKVVKSNADRGEWMGYEDNEHKLCATYPVKSSTGNVIGYVRYSVELGTTDKRITGIVFAIIFVLLLIAVLLFYFNKSFIRSLVRPINELNEATKEIAEGKYNISVHYYGDDEIGQLYSSVETMTNEISRTDKMKNEFITTVSHELRTPLTAIKGWGETIMDLGVNNPSLIKNGVQVIIKESERLSELVEELLDFSKFQSEEFTLRTQTIDVLAELDDTAFSLKEHATRDNIQFTCTTPEVPAVAVADPNRIRQVFVNIIGNAIKYTGEGGKVEVFANIVDNHLIIFVRDNGCGIDSKDLPHVKEKFYKANDTIHGNGIGLAVADEIIKLHGGSLEIKSEVNVGTIVRITLPLVDPSTFDRREEDV